MKNSSPIALFAVLAFGLSWLLALPLWMGDGLRHRFFAPIAVMMMWTPALAALITSRLTAPRTPLVVSLGIAPRRPFGRTARYAVGAMAAAFVLSAVALLIGQVIGVYRFDLHHFSAFEQALRSHAPSGALARLPPLPVLVGAQLLMLIPASLFNAIAAAGEEIGWRGWLLPRLLPLGTGPAIVISGVVWGAWHAPLVLLGYNYPGAPAWLAMLCMMVMCILLGGLLAWLRLRSGSIWPGAIGHGAVNASGGLYVLLGAASGKVDTTQATLLGWTGWILPAILLWFLFRSKEMRDGQAA